MPLLTPTLNSGPFPPPALPGSLGVGSEEARRSASLRPPLKLDVRFSRIQLSQRRILGGRFDEGLGEIRRANARSHRVEGSRLRREPHPRVARFRWALRDRATAKPFCL